MGNKKKEVIKYFIIGAIIVVIQLIMLFIINIMQDGTLKIRNKQETLGVIVDIKDISGGRIQHALKPSYYGTLIVQYEVNGNIYCIYKRVKSDFMFNIPNMSEYSITDTIPVIYNSEKPTEAAIDIVENYEKVIISILIIEILIIVVFILVKILKKKKLYLKVIKIESKDIQRERIFFEEKRSKKLFFIDYDIGEQIKIGEEFELNNAYKNNFEKQVIIFDNKKVKAYLIINIDKDIFLKINNK